MRYWGIVFETFHYLVIIIVTPAEGCAAADKQKSSTGLWDLGVFINLVNLRGASAKQFWEELERLGELDELDILATTLRPAH
jgi:hypothetical protein